MFSSCWISTTTIPCGWSQRGGGQDLQADLVTEGGEPAGVAASLVRHASTFAGSVVSRRPRLLPCPSRGSARDRPAVRDRAWRGSGPRPPHHPARSILQTDDREDGGGGEGQEQGEERQDTAGDRKGPRPPGPR